MYIHRHAFHTGRIATPYFARKGTNGVSTNGVTEFFRLFDRWTFWVLQLTYFYLPQKGARAYIFPQPDKIYDFAAAPLMLTPCVRNQFAIGPSTQETNALDDVPEPIAGNPYSRLTA